MLVSGDSRTPAFTGIESGQQPQRGPPAGPASFPPAYSPQRHSGFPISLFLLLWLL